MRLDTFNPWWRVVMSHLARVSEVGYITVGDKETNVVSLRDIIDYDIKYSWGCRAAEHKGW